MNEAPGGEGQMTTDRSAAAGQWWKAWVLLTGLGATLLGWMAFPSDEQPPTSSVAPSGASMPAANEPVVRVEPVDGQRRVPTNVRTLPAMPQRPVFEAPVTRTRRS